MNYLLSFSPWIAYAVVGSVGSWRTGVIVAAILQAGLLISLLRKRQLDLLSIGTLIFFAAMSVVAIASPHSSVHKWIPALSPGALALISGLSLLAGRPFTLEIAKRTTPESAWSLPQFIQINRFLTAVWTASFTGSAVVCALLIGEAVAAAKARAAAAGVAV